MLVKNHKLVSIIENSKNEMKDYKNQPHSFGMNGKSGNTLPCMTYDVPVNRFTPRGIARSDALRVPAFPTEKMNASADGS